MIWCANRYSFLEPRLNHRLPSKGTPPICPPVFNHSTRIGTNEILVAGGIREKTEGFQTEIPAKSNLPGSWEPRTPSKSTTRPVSLHQWMLFENPVVRSANVTSLRFEKCSSKRQPRGKSVKRSPLYTTKGLSPIWCSIFLIPPPVSSNSGSCTSSTGIP